jgi:hypothetical protein
MLRLLNSNVKNRENAEEVNIGILRMKMAIVHAAGCNGPRKKRLGMNAMNALPDST